MTCEIRVSTKFNQGNDESFFSVKADSPDQIGAIVAIIARKALEGNIGRDSYDVFEAMLDWFIDDCPNWDMLCSIGRGYEIVYYYHIRLSNNSRDGKLEIEIGFSQRGLPVRYVSVNEWIAEVNRVRKEINHLFASCQFPSFRINYTPAKMLRKAQI